MSQNNNFKYSNALLLAPMVAILSIWIVFWLEIKLGTNFNEFGIAPRKIIGLRGVIFSPFIHGSVEHLYNNTIPLAILIITLFYFYSKEAFKVILFGILFSGLLTWCIGRPSHHIGASGLIYVLVSFVFFKGIFAKHYRLIALSLAIVFLYGSMVWYVFPLKEGVSWEGHLSGFIVGLVFAFLFKVTTPVEKKYSWEKEGYKEEDDEFLKHFDADGNFIENVENDTTNAIEITYHYKKNKEQID